MNVRGVLVLSLHFSDGTGTQGGHRGSYFEVVSLPRYLQCLADRGKDDGLLCRSCSWVDLRANSYLASPKDQFIAFQFGTVRGIWHLSNQC